DTRDEQWTDGGYRVQALSADGRLILFTPFGVDPAYTAAADQFRMYDREQNHVFSAFPDGALSSPQLGVKHVQMSSDGRFIAFMSRDNGDAPEEVYLLDRESNELTWVTRNVRQVSNLDSVD